MDKLREDFENECKKLGYTEKFWFFRRTHPNRYDEDNIEDMYYMWKASRESLDVELPEDLTPEYEGDDFKNISDAAYCRGYNQAMREAELAIEAAGIKVVSK